jgi:hypothetical protein
LRKALSYGFRATSELKRRNDTKVTRGFLVEQLPQ